MLESASPEKGFACYRREQELIGLPVTDLNIVHKPGRLKIMAQKYVSQGSPLFEMTHPCVKSRTCHQELICRKVDGHQSM